MASDLQPTTLPVLRSTRGHLKGSLTKLTTYIESITDATSYTDLKIRYYKVDDLWKEFLVTQKQLYTFSDSENYTDPLPEFEEFEAKVLIVKSSLLAAITEREKIDKKNDVVSQLATQQKVLIDTLSQSTSVVKQDDGFLPSVRIEPFSGNYKDWPSFRDTFQSVVSNKPKLSPIRKFQFLISCLRGDALSLLSHLKVCDDTYEEAWEKLDKRFNRPRHIVNNFVKAFMDLPSVHTSNVSVLRKISDGADEIVRGLTSISSLTRDPWLIYILINKLDFDTRQAWSEDYYSEDYPTINQLLDFLDRRCEALESCRTSTRESNPIKKPPVKSMLASISIICQKCNANHGLTQCQMFLDMDVQARREFVKTNKLCFNCLRSGHPSARCQSKFRCKACNTRHHSLVHDDSINSTTINSTTKSSDSSTKINNSLVYDPNKDFVPQTNNTSLRSSQTTNFGSVNSHNSVNIPSSSPQALINNHSHINHSIKTLLPTALGKVLDVNGKSQIVRMLIDTGSQVSFVTESCAQRLGLKRKNARIPISGIGSTQAGSSRGLLSLAITSRCDTYSISVDTYILSSVTTNLPTSSFTIEDWDYLHRLELADPWFNQSRPVDILLGVDKAWEILQGQRFKSRQGYPIAQRTIFGWVLAGPLPPNKPFFTSHHVHINIDSLLQSFWTIEEVNPKSIVSNEDKQIEEHFVKTHRRDSSGKYVVDLPFKSPPSFGDTLNGAITRLKWMENKFSKNPNLFESYTRFLDEYLSLGHMSRVPPEEISKSNVFYLPHHAVLKPESSSTKLRVVFDGSFKDRNGYSLNDALMIGPPIQRNLFSVCLRFRRHKFVFSADIIKMFRQIMISEQDTDFQRIVWRKSPTEPVQHFRLHTVTYGTSCAPFLAVRVLEQLARDYRDEFPIASDIILNDFYVDDVVSGGDTLSEATFKRDSLIKLLEKCGMRLSKWQSNCPELRQDSDGDAIQNHSLDVESDSWTKVLGLFWNSKTDVFSFRLNYNPEDTITKRQILRDIARIFDPLGFLSPSVVQLKILLQELWQRNIDWDDKLPYPMACRWKKYREELPALTKIEVPRTIGLGRIAFELHAFSDASASAYAAVIYSRYQLPDGTYQINILAAKTRVSPLKQLSIPRLELCGAVLLTRLLIAVQNSLEVTFDNVFAWSDSKVVLSWLSSPPRRWNVFVGNRTSEILDAIPRNRWFHVRSDVNPADCASRGISPSQLLEHPIWWTGPQWLRENNDAWPIVRDLEDDPLCKQEEKIVPPQSYVTVIDDHPIEELSTRISSWNVLIRTVARMQRFIDRCRKEDVPSSLHLEPTEIFNAKKIIIKWLQNRYFGECIKAFTQHDDHGILRVGGRITEANVSFNTKHPIILPKGDIITKLIALDAHKRFCHPGISTLFALIRQEYWIIGCRNLLRKITHDCISCFRQRKATTNQLMGNLPPPRIQVSRPFAHCGCDYAGPISLKVKSGRKSHVTKGYISLFVCLVTKAIHLELVSDLTTDAFLAALRRFVARRGKPSHLYTDNGTNFRGSARSLSEMHKLLLSQTHNSIVADSLARDEISWHFIPPSSPHFGGESYAAVPEPMIDIPTNRLSCWQQLQSKIQGYWKRWQMEYLTSLQQRPRWQQSQTNIKVNDLVVIKESNLPPGKWAMGRVIDTHPGKDGHVRVVTLRTTNGNLVRPIHKLAILPCSETVIQGRGNV
ncbi:uncharacterized protein LOC129913542 [Episyrphus balteatus]|uniref:uncharacterized protein LOC129913542 n=1 Tax=Episyrphus balteatus TaxID=286459 RepID=UPI002485752F|nr:uncharacterized protein LOC129913542 [Episyrphus balteatus]